MGSMDEIENANITSTNIGPENHGIFTAGLMLSGAGWGQGFGNYALKHSDHAYHFINGVIKAVGVELWENLPGKVCRVKRDNGLIIAVGHIVEDRWYEPRVDLKA